MIPAVPTENEIITTQLAKFEITWQIEMRYVSIIKWPQNGTIRRQGDINKKKQFLLNTFVDP